MKNNNKLNRIKKFCGEWKMVYKEDDQQEARNLITELRILESTAETLQTRINYVNAFLNELLSANMALTGLEKEEKNTSLLVPIGGGSYVRAKLEDVEKVVYGVGAGVSIEKTIEEAKEGMAQRISELEKTNVSLKQQITQIYKRIQEGQVKFQELTSRAKGPVKN
jgi:prefoldin alpha subunit